MTEYQESLTKRINELELLMSLGVFTLTGFDHVVARLKKELKEELGKKAI